jgi:ABC-type branched-subunit amino acid transport system ATPase component
MEVYELFATLKTGQGQFAGTLNGGEQLMMDWKKLM